MFDFYEEYTSNPLSPYIRLFTPWLANEIDRCTAPQLSALEMAEQGLFSASDDELAKAQIRKSLLPALDNQLDELRKNTGNEIDFVPVEYAICFTLAQFAPYSLHASIALEMLRQHRRENLRVGALISLLASGREDVSVEPSELAQIVDYRLLTSVPLSYRYALINSLRQVCDRHPQLAESIAEAFFRARVRMYENKHFLWLVFFAERGICNQTIIEALVAHIRAGYDADHVTAPTMNSVLVSRRLQAITALHHCMDKNADAIELYGKEILRLGKPEDIPRRALISAIESISTLSLLNTLYPILWRWAQTELKPFGGAATHVYRILAKLCDLGFRRDETIALFSERIAENDEITVWYALDGVKHLCSPSVGLIQQALVIAISNEHTNASSAARRCVVEWSQNVPSFITLLKDAFAHLDMTDAAASKWILELGIKMP